MVLALKISAVCVLIDVLGVTVDKDSFNKSAFTTKHSLDVFSVKLLQLCDISRVLDHLCRLINVCMPVYGARYRSKCEFHIW
jgi:hypothetical protein